MSAEQARLRRPCRPLPIQRRTEALHPPVRWWPNVAKVVVGERVGMSFSSCGTCPACMMGRPTYCHDFFARNFGGSRPDGTTALWRGGEPIHSHFFGHGAGLDPAPKRRRHLERHIVVELDDVALG